MPLPFGILVPQPGIEPGPLAVDALSLNYWTAREFPACALLITSLLIACLLGGQGHMFHPLLSDFFLIKFFF